MFHTFSLCLVYNSKVVWYIDKYYIMVSRFDHKTAFTWIVGELKCTRLKYETNPIHLLQCWLFIWYLKSEHQTRNACNYFGNYLKYYITTHLGCIDSLYIHARCICFNITIFYSIPTKASSSLTVNYYSAELIQICSTLLED